MNRDETLAFACSHLCLEIQTVDQTLLSPVNMTVVQAFDQEKDLVTWLVEGGRFLTLIQTARGTRIYDTHDDFLYYATPHTQLPKTCPVGHAFLCQSVQDKQPDGSFTPRLLVTDLLSPRIDCPVKRGEVLRGMGHFLPPVCHIQWAGNREALERFVKSGVVPHRVAGLVALRSPLSFAREPATKIAALDALACLSK
jgi:hypothetical protein